MTEPAVLDKKEVKSENHFLNFELKRTDLGIEIFLKSPKIGEYANKISKGEIIEFDGYAYFNLGEKERALVNLPLGVDTLANNTTVRDSTRLCVNGACSFRYLFRKEIGEGATFKLKGIYPNSEIKIFTDFISEYASELKKLIKREDK